MTHYGRSGEEIRGEIGRWSLSHTCMKTSARSRFWIRETGKASINGHMPSKSRETKEKGGPVPPAHILSIPPVPDSSGVSSHCPATISRPPLRELPHRRIGPLGASHTWCMAHLVALSSPLGPRSATRGKGGEWRMAGFAKNRTPTTRQKKTLVQRANSNRPSRSAAALAQGPSAALCLLG